jgi:hypothetical protein
LECKDARALAPRVFLIQTLLSWNAAPPYGAIGSAPVTVLMPQPSAKAEFGQIDSAISTP